MGGYQNLYYNRAEVILQKYQGKDKDGNIKPDKRYLITDSVLDGIEIKRSPNEASTCTFTVKRHGLVDTGGNLTNKALEPEPGDSVSVRIDGQGVFFGWILEPEYSEYKVTCTAYDQLYYLSAVQDSMNYGDVELSKLCKRIFADFSGYGQGLRYKNNFDYTGYTLPEVILDGGDLLSCIRDGIDSVYKNTGRRFYLFDDYSELKLLEDTTLRDFLRDKFWVFQDTVLGGYNIKKPVPSGMKTQFKVVKNDEEKGMRTTAITYSEGLIERYGLMQGYQEAQADENPGTLSKQLFRENSKMPITITCSDVIGQRDIWGGALIWLDFYSQTTAPAREGYKGWCRVDGVTHKFKDGTHLMDLDLTYTESAF